MSGQAKKPLEADFAALLAADADFAAVIDRFGAPPSRRRKPGFATLLRIIMGQQVSTASAAGIWRRMNRAMGNISARGILRQDETALRAMGLSGQKIRYAHILAAEIDSGGLRLNQLNRMDNDDAMAALIRIKGIGRWTAEIYLLSALQRKDVWPAGDLALMIAVQELKGLPERPDAAAMIVLAEAWRPWRSSAARLLWHDYGGRRGRLAQPLGDG